MKTAEQIEEWLKSQKWYRSYKRNVTKYNKTSKIENFITGKKGKSTIIGAFIWSEYPYRGKSGIDFWSKVNNEFIKWFND